MNKSLIYLILAIVWGMPSTEVNSTTISSNHIMQPFDNQRRISSLPSKIFIYPDKKTQVSDSYIDTTVQIFNSNLFLHDPSIKQGNTSISPVAIINNTREKHSSSENKASPNPNMLGEYLIKIFDEYGIFGGIIALFILFSGIRYCLKS